MEKIYFTPGTDCLNAIIRELRNAEKSVDVCVFTISDNRISEVLNEIFLSGIRVRIITDNEKRFDLGSDIDFLSKTGIDVKTDITEAHMHHKFAVIDDSITITGSYNWTRSAGDYNYENIIVTDNEKVAREFSNEFESLWKKMKLI